MKLGFSLAAETAAEFATPRNLDTNAGLTFLIELDSVK
jgi:hypothetical protein